MKRPTAKGFTLAELLIVVAIIGVLVAIAIPVFINQLERSREATDIANARGAYASVMAEATAGDYTMEVSFLVVQKIEDWQRGDTITIGSITHVKGSGDSDQWEGVPSEGGTCTVLYVEGVGAKFIWKDGNGQTQGTNGSSWTQSPATNLNIKSIGSGYVTKDNYSAATTEQQQLVDQLKEYFGYDEITVAFGNHGNYKGCFLVTVGEGTYAADGMTNVDTATRLFIDKNTGEIIAVWEQKGSWGSTTNSEGKAVEGFWGASGQQSVVYECDNIDNYR